VASTPKPRALWLRETSNALQSSGQYEEALVYATAAIATDPLDRFNYLQKAHCLMEMGRFSDAVLAMEAAIRLGSISHVQQHRYAVILQELGRVQEAVDVEQSVVEAVPEFFPSLFKRAELLVSLDRPQEGLEAYRAALPLAGGHAATVENRITALTQLSAPATQAPTPVKPVSAAENIKMIIWDLDETFWSGTLSEEGIKPIQAHIDLIKEMSGRGIVNSICSKNDFAAAERELRKLEIWDHFVFPKIEFSPKGAMIRDIIDAAQLRAPSVLFVDDNVMNLNEAVHYSPGLQIAEPDVISRLLDDARCAGKTDPKMERLARYKVLEQKFLAQANAGADNIDFLRESGIRVSFHHDVMSEFPRIHDLVNRSNQLNFTKKRWPEDENLAREAFTEELAAVFDSHSGYIKVADRYGNYGICGFYMTRGAACQHFLFSCRAMNMGVEQFVWHKLNRPHVNISSEVASTLEASPDWITVVEDADKVDPQIADTSAKPLICVRGACDLMMMTHYLRTRFDTIEEFTFPYKGWAIHQLARVVALEKDIQIPASQALLAMLPGIPPNRFESAVNTGAADVYVLSFSAEIFGGLRRSRTTGIILPLYEEKIGDQDFRNVSYAELQERYNGAAQVNAQEWAFLQDEFENIPHLHEPQLKADLTDVFTKLRGKTVIVLMLNTKVGNRKWTLDAFAKINAIVRPIAESFNAHIIELEEMVRSVDDLADPEDPGVHFSRRIYMQLADRIAEICEAHATRTPAGGLNVDRVKSN
jgi:FkbH-like protein